ncbi:hypothetical protein HOY80DRAFT_1020523 [Tuber brumale]|nr:hypothetical protein HOY80DRAFT_1020523 [Tuber brumale]
MLACTRDTRTVQYECYHAPNTVPVYSSARVPVLYQGVRAGTRTNPSTPVFGYLLPNMSIASGLSAGTKTPQREPQRRKGTVIGLERRATGTTISEPQRDEPINLSYIPGACIREADSNLTGQNWGASPYHEATNLGAFVEGGKERGETVCYGTSTVPYGSLSYEYCALATGALGLGGPTRVCSPRSPLTPMRFGEPVPVLCSLQVMYSSTQVPVLPVLLYRKPAQGLRMREKDEDKNKPNQKEETTRPNFVPVPPRI